MPRKSIMEFTYDDTLPLPSEVEKEFSDKAGDRLTATEWLVEHGIPPRADAALIQYGVTWNPETGRYRFVIYDSEHVGPKNAAELAIPIYEDGAFLDLLCISDEMSFARVTCRAKWLGRENLAGPVVRLHAHPMDWLESGTGVCHIEPCSRKALKELSRAATIECNCIYTALEAWDWGFAGEDDELSRFEIDDSLFAIRQYFEDEVRWRTAYLIPSRRNALAERAVQS